MAKKSEKPVYAFIKTGDGLYPEMEYDLHALDGIPNGQRVKVEIKEWRSLGSLRAYWAMLQDVIDATEAAPTKEILHEVIKLETGFIETIRLPNGMRVAIPASIAFDKMDAMEFVRFFKGAEKWLAETYGYAPTETSTGLERNP
jgi:hypothetical protein